MIPLLCLLCAVLAVGWLITWRRMRSHRREHDLYCKSYYDLAAYHETLKDQFTERCCENRALRDEAANREGNK